jgi:adenylate cyclase
LNPKPVSPVGTFSASGCATLRRIGFEGRFDCAAIGPMPNLDSRLCDDAGDGEILISERALVEAQPVHHRR